MAVSQAQRFTPSHPCPVCGGHYNAPRGKGIRCYGYESHDGKWANCTRPEYAGTLQMSRNSSTFNHHLAGRCDCGVVHDPASPPPTAPIGYSRVAPSKPFPTSDAPRQRRTEVARWHIRDSQQQVQAIHIRYQTSDGEKSYAWQRPDGQWGLGGRPDVSLPLYGSDLLPLLAPGTTVVVTEGEKSADALLDLDIAAVGTVTGAHSIPSYESLTVLRGQNVVLWPDNDPQGQRHMHRIASRLSTMGILPRITHWDEAPPKGDAADYVSSHARQDVLGLLALSPPCPPPPAPTNQLTKTPPPAEADPLAEAPPDDDEYYAGKERGLQRRLLAMDMQTLPPPPPRENMGLYPYVGLRIQTHVFSFDGGALPGREVELSWLRGIYQSRDYYHDRDDPRYLAAEACLEGRWYTRECDALHPYVTSRAACHSKWCHRCWTQTAETLSELRYPDLSGDSCYRITVFSAMIRPNEGEGLDDWKIALPDRVADEHRRWAHEVLLLSLRHQFRERFGARGTVYSLHDWSDENCEEVAGVRVYHILIISEDKEGETDKAMQRIAQRLSLDHIETQRTQSGEAVAQQLVEMTYRNLVGVDYLDERTAEAMFHGLYMGTQHARLFQSFGALREMIEGRKALRAEHAGKHKTCEVVLTSGEICGKPYHLRRAYPHELPTDPRRLLTFHRPGPPASVATPIPRARGPALIAR